MAQIGFEDHPQGQVDCVTDFAYFVARDELRGGCALQLKHPSHGWLNFYCPPEVAEKLAQALLEWGKAAAGPQGQPQ